MNLNKMLIVACMLSAFSLTAMGSENGLCKSLKNFAASVKPNEIKSLEFQTSWGSNFKDDPEEALYAKRCIHNDYELAKAVCNYLMANGSVEFSGANFKEALTCLSPKSKFDQELSFHTSNVSLSYRTESRGSLVEITLESNEKIGGMVLKVEANDY